MKKQLKDMSSLSKAVMGQSEEELRGILKKLDERETERYIEKLESRGYFVRKIQKEA